MPCLSRFVAAALMLLLASAPRAHEFWMLPSGFRTAPGQSTVLSLAVGEDFSGDAVAFAPEFVARLDHHAAGKRTALAARTAPGARSAGVPALLPHGGTHLFVFDSTPTHIELPADTFEAYLRQEGLHHVLRQRAQAGTGHLPGRERYRRHAKTLVQAGARGDATFARRAGQRLEIVPLSDPLAAAAPASLTFQVLFQGAPLGDALLKLWHRPPGSGRPVLLERVTGADGRATLALPDAGTWMASVVHMVPATGVRDADWDSFWSSLTFALPPRGTAQPRVSGAPRR